MGKALTELREGLDLIDQIPDDIGIPFYSTVLGDLFGISTDDEGADSGEAFMLRCILESYFAIRDGNVYKYIDNSHEDYIRYIVGFNILSRMDVLNYGVSVRGAWLESYADKELFGRLDRVMERALKSWNEDYPDDKMKVL